MDMIRLFDLTIEHEYYQSLTGNGIRIAPTRETMVLMHGCGAMFGAVGNGYGCFVRDDWQGFGNIDVLEFSMQVMNPNFLATTKLDGGCESDGCLFSLRNEGVTNACDALTPADALKRQPLAFCIRLYLPEKLRSLAFSGFPLKYTLKFETRSYRWEYLVIDRTGQGLNFRNLILEERTGQIIFSKGERMNWRFGDVCRIVSTTYIPARERPEYRLDLCEIFSEDPLRKRVLSRELPFPEFGRIPSDERDVLRQICFI